MANLLGNDIGLNYKGLLNLDTTINTGLDGTLRVVTDGEGDSSPLYLSTTQVGVKATTDNNSIVAEFKTSANIKVLEILDRGSLTQYSRVDGTTKTFELGFAGGFDAGAITLYKTNVAKVFLQVHDTSASYINVGGNLGINNTSPVAKLDIVAAASTVGLYVKGAASTDIFRVYDSSGTQQLSMLSTGRLQFNADTEFYRTAAGQLGINHASGPELDFLTNGTLRFWMASSTSVAIISAMVNTLSLRAGNNICQTLSNDLTTTFAGTMITRAGTTAAGTSPFKFTNGVIMTTPELGALEFEDDGTTGHLYVTVRIASVVTRVQIV